MGSEFNLRRWVVLAAAIAVAVSGLSEARAADAMLRAADSFDRYHLNDPATLARIKATHDLSGGQCCVTGWVEYDFTIATDGWYRLLVHGQTDGVEYLVDADALGRTVPESRFLGGSGQNLPVDKIGNLWLTAGRHRVRLQRNYWMGFPKISAVELQPGDGTLGDAVAVAGPPSGSMFRAGECPSLDVIAGGLANAETLRISETDPYTYVTYHQYAIQVAASMAPQRYRLALPCTADGARILWFGDSHGSIRNERLRGYAYEVFDTHAPAKPPSAAVATAPIVDIDCAAREPDFGGGGPTRVVQLPGRSYRESGDTGWTRYQRAPEIVRRAMPEPSWFAYALPELGPQQQYRIDVDYPDDAWRTFGMVLRESAPLAYPVAAGVDTGGEFPLSGSLQTMSMTVWPRGVSPRLTFMTAHNGSRAACSRIRVYRAAPAHPIAAEHPPEFRRVLNWQEEGANFASLFGPVDESFRGRRQAAERWAEAAQAIGATTLMPTVAVYGFALYPSRFNVAFSDQREDALRRILLVAERSGLGVVPELHPRADELAWGRAATDPPPGNLLVDGKGRNNFYANDGKTRNYPPYFNALSQGNQDWYVGMIGELADRYKDSPAFEGISLRVSKWANPALNNLVSLDWGYDDETVNRFKSETGSAVPLGSGTDVGRFAARYAWLTTVGKREWVDWRCRKIADLTRRIVDRVRQARPDLKVYLNVVAGGDELTAGLDTPREDVGVPPWLRNAGIDPAVLGAIDGVVLVNATYRYGRREADELLRGYRDTLLSRRDLSALRVGGDSGHFMATQNYLEATEAVVPPERLGFPATTRRTWTGVVANPPGRIALERYAIQLADGDALTLGDGGNGYSFGPPIIREFLENFRRLPSKPFNSRADAQDPVTVRSLPDGGRYYFYAVNRLSTPVVADIRLSGISSCTRLVNESAQPVVDGHVRLVLRPYELVAFAANPTANVEAVGVSLPATEYGKVEAQIRAVEKLAGLPPLATLLNGGPTEVERRLLVDAAASSRGALARGRLWEAHSALDRSWLWAIYARTGCYPPGFLSGSATTSSCAQ